VVVNFAKGGALSMATRITVKITTSALIFAVAFLFLATNLKSQVQMETQGLVFPQMAVGEGWESELTLVAQGAEASAGEIWFIGQNGIPMAVTVDGGTPVTSVSYSLPSRSSRTYKLTSTGSTRSGWILLGNNNTSKQGSINGTLTYRYRPDGIFRSQVGVLPSQAMSLAHLPYDNTNNNKTAIAIAMLQPGANVEFARYNEEGAFQDSQSIYLGAMNQQALYVNQLFPSSADSRGFLTISSSAVFNMVALNDYAENYSSTAVLPAVLEREVTLVGPDVSSSQTLRLTRQGNYFTGVSDRTSPTPRIRNYVSGIIATTPLGRKYLCLNIQTINVSNGKGINITMLGLISDERLLDVSGTIYISQEESSSTQGTFTLSARPGAQF
jgi:hypothetical protein